MPSSPPQPIFSKSKQPTPQLPNPNTLPSGKPKSTDEAMGWAVVCCYRLMGYVESATTMSQPAGEQQIGLLERELAEALAKVRGLRKHDAAQEQTEMFT